MGIGGCFSTQRGGVQPCQQRERAAPNTPPTDSKWKSGAVWCQGGYAGGGAAQPDPPGTENSAAGLEKN